MGPSLKNMYMNTIYKHSKIWTTGKQSENVIKYENEIYNELMEWTYNI